MGQITVSLGDFNRTSTGTSVYGATVTFDVPANAGITGCTATFTTLVDSGSFRNKAFLINGAQATDSGLSTTGYVNHALLVTGQNTFRVAINAQSGKTATWSISDIQLHITYNDPSGGSGSVNIGTFRTNTGRLTAGEQIRLTLGACDPSISREITVWHGGGYNSQVGTVPGIFNSDYHEILFTVPESWCGTIAPYANSAKIMFYLTAYLTAGGALQGNLYNIATVDVPASAVPTIGAFTATRDANGVDASITNYVQNYSKVNLEMSGVAGALGSSIQSYEITGAGFSAAAASASFGPFAQTGDITFTATVTDSRGRTATKTVTINVLSYGPVAFTNPEAWRSSDIGVKSQKGTYARLKSGVVYSSLDGQNSVTLKGRVYPKGGTVPAYTSMTPDTPWIAGGGLLLVTKTYIAQMEVADLISSRTVEFTIPTKKTGISIMAGMQGIAFGKSAEITGHAEFGWPIYVGDDRVALRKECPYRIGDVIFSIVSANPAETWPATTWSAIPSGRVIRTGEGGTESGSDTHVHSTAAVALTEAQMPAHNHTITTYTAGSGGPGAAYTYRGSKNGSEISNTKGSGQAHGHGNTGSASNVPLSFHVYAWRRTA